MGVEMDYVAMGLGVSMGLMLAVIIFFITGSLC